MLKFGSVVPQPTNQKKSHGQQEGDEIKSDSKKVLKNN